jgi:hypothetical protein
MSGFDWTTYDGMQFPVNVVLNTQILPGIPVLPANVALDSFTQVEGASGSTHNDVIRGSVTAADMPTEGSAAARSTPRARFHRGPAGSVDRRTGSLDGQGRFVGGNILPGGAGSDTIEGRGGDDIIDGDRWPAAHRGTSGFNDNGPTGTPVEFHDSMTTLVRRCSRA